MLWRKLQDAGITNIDFVGTLPPQGCGFTYDGENEGHGGYLATNIAKQNQLVGWLDKTKPDIVMMHLGTNDVWNNLSPTEILASFDTLVKQMRESKPSMKILVSLLLTRRRVVPTELAQVAQIIPMNPPNCQDCGNRVVNLDKAIAEWVPQVTTAESPITLVDCWTGFDDATMTGDGVHPNDRGNEAMANCWLNPLINAIQGK